MEANNNYSANSSSSSMYSQQQARAMLHSVRKPQSKPWKKPIAPLPPTPPRLYKVDPINFRDLVQKLTSAPEFQTHRLRKMAPPPLDVVVLADHHHRHRHEQLPRPPADDHSSANANISLEFNLLPSPLGWCSFPLLSPGTLSPLDQTRISAVL
ncbi:hypothetical protein HS088_TW03G00006 [Tripterygium wilfordii]|uniref:VQ domain-containing protein n=1 Tax=Tripterygium wilfordii TaxID=458696 RepID=A0A7J7DTQ3_TRIWF|nr:uncharacterized protein LOC119990686 [Tripterygium wilfordii]KAF5749681.1 hypothetical protein HS088_TW03G00006 [Tripterygium wilfordii]